MIPKYKDIVDLMKKGATVEAQEKIMDLREGVLELQEENAILKEENRKLIGKINVRDYIEFEKGLYWLWQEDDLGDCPIKSGPFCQKCYDDEEKLIRLQEFSSECFDSESGVAVKTNDYYKCLKCENMYMNK